MSNQFIDGLKAQLSACAYTATIQKADKADRLIHFDSMGMNGFGFVFIRSNGETEFVNASCIDHMETRPALETTGPAQ